jgi:hypothetical protein
MRVQQVQDKNRRRDGNFEDIIDDRDRSYLAGRSGCEERWSHRCEGDAQLGNWTFFAFCLLTGGERQRTKLAGCQEWPEGTLY